MRDRDSEPKTPYLPIRQSETRYSSDPKTDRQQKVTPLSMSEKRLHPRRIARLDENGEVIATSGIHQAWLIDLKFGYGTLMCRKRKTLMWFRLRAGLPRLVEIDFPIGNRIVRTP